MLFPFGLVLDQALKVRLAGEQILQLMGKDMLGSEFLQYFTVQRPHVTFSWEVVSTQARGGSLKCPEGLSAGVCTRGGREAPSRHYLVVHEKLGSFG